MVMLSVLLLIALVTAPVAAGVPEPGDYWSYESDWGSYGPENSCGATYLFVADRAGTSYSGQAVAEFGIATSRGAITRINWKISYRNNTTGGTGSVGNPNQVPPAIGYTSYEPRVYMTTGNGGVTFTVTATIYWSNSSGSGSCVAPSVSKSAYISAIQVMEP
jgi:hypothetical protein